MGRSNRYAVRKWLNENERAVLREIRKFRARYWNSPTIDELAVLLAMSQGSVESYLKSLCEKGFVDIVRISITDRRVIVPLFWE